MVQDLWYVVSSLGPIFKGLYEAPFAGDLIYIEMLGQPIIVLHSRKVTSDLLEKRASNYSDRTKTPSVEMLQLNWSFGMRDYGQYWKDERRIFHQHYCSARLREYYPAFEEQSRVFLRGLLERPSEFSAITKQ